MDKPCNKDCFHCLFEDCILDRLDSDDYGNTRRIEREFLFPKTRRQKAISAKKREYREANREEIAAKQRAYYEANREEIAAKNRAYYEAKREEIAAKKRAYREANREELAGYGLFLKCIRTEKGYTQRELAALCGVSQTTISFWESGKLPPDLDKLLPVLMPTAEKANMEEKKGKKKSAR